MPTIIAAPGVLHATITGALKRSDNSNVSTPQPSPKAVNHELICCAVLPKAWAA